MNKPLVHEPYYLSNPSPVPTKRWTSHHINPEFSSMIWQRRVDLGLTRLQLAQRLNCHEMTIYYLETKRRTMLLPDDFWALYNALEFDEHIDPPEDLFRWAYCYDIKGM